MLQRDRDASVASTPNPMETQADYHPIGGYLACSGSAATCTRCEAPLRLTPDVQLQAV